eukprot:1103110-Pelagomonas_calceolata.AAC.1
MRSQLGVIFVFIAAQHLKATGCSIEAPELYRLEQNDTRSTGCQKKTPENVLQPAAKVGANFPGLLACKIHDPMGEAWGSPGCPPPPEQMTASIFLPRNRLILPG